MLLFGWQLLIHFNVYAKLSGCPNARRSVGAGLLCRVEDFIDKECLVRSMCDGPDTVKVEVRYKMPSKRNRLNFHRANAVTSATAHAVGFETPSGLEKLLGPTDSSCVLLKGTSWNLLS